MIKPKIGILFHRFIKDNYGAAIYKSGGVPIYFGTEICPAAALELVDGIFLAGGGDILPSVFGETITNKTGLPDVARDYSEIAMVKAAASLGIPVLGICRGMQVINVALGGTIYQDIGKSHIQKDNPLKATHQIDLARGSSLLSLVQEEALMVNSFHHQSVNKLGMGLKAVAHSEDNIVEAIEGNNILGLQWHAEWLFHRVTEQKIFSTFIGRAYDYSQKT